jgi:hypothetical protein
VRDMASGPIFRGYRHQTCEGVVRDRVPSSRGAVLTRSTGANEWPAPNTTRMRLRGGTRRPVRRREASRCGSRYFAYRENPRHRLSLARPVGHAAAAPGRSARQLGRTAHGAGACRLFDPIRGDRRRVGSVRCAIARGRRLEDRRGGRRTGSRYPTCRRRCLRRTGRPACP